MCAILDNEADTFLQGGKPHFSHEQWLQTMSEYQNWAIITTIRTISTIDLLEEDLKKQINDILKGKPLTGKYAPHRVFVYPLGADKVASEFRWVSATLHVTEKKSLPLYHPSPDSGWFWLGQSLDKHKALLVKENQPGQLGKIAGRNRIWDSNDGGKNTGNGILIKLEP